MLATVAITLVIHGFNAVAELKVSLRISTFPANKVIHGFNAVAELKARKESRGGRRPYWSSTASTPWPN